MCVYSSMCYLCIVQSVRLGYLAETPKCRPGDVDINPRNQRDSGAKVPILDGAPPMAINVFPTPQGSFISQ